MSSLIDFDNNHSSQDNDMEMIEDIEPEPEPTQRPKTDEESRKKMMLEVALYLHEIRDYALTRGRKQRLFEPDCSLLFTR